MKLYLPVKKLPLIITDWSIPGYLEGIIGRIGGGVCARTVAIENKIREFICYFAALCFSG
jgi:hypothetical protein